MTDTSESAEIAAVITAEQTTVPTQTVEIPVQLAGRIELTTEMIFALQKLAGACIRSICAQHNLGEVTAEGETGRPVVHVSLSGLRKPTANTVGIIRGYLDTAMLAFTDHT